MKKLSEITSDSIQNLDLSVSTHIPVAKDFLYCIKDIKEIKHGGSTKSLCSDKTLESYFNTFFGKLSDESFLCIIAASCYFSELHPLFASYKDILQRTKRLATSENQFYEKIKTEYENLTV